MELEDKLLVLGTTFVVGAGISYYVCRLSKAVEKVAGSIKEIRGNATKVIDAVLCYYNSQLSNPKYASQLRELSKTRAETRI